MPHCHIQRRFRSSVGGETELVGEEVCRGAGVGGDEGEV